MGQGRSSTSALGLREETKATNTHMPCREWAVMEAGINAFSGQKRKEKGEWEERGQIELDCE